MRINKLGFACIFLTFVACKAKEGPYLGLLLENQAALTTGPNHLVQRFRPQGDQPKELFAPNESGDVFILPDEQSFFLLGEKSATLVSGTDQYTPVALPVQERAFAGAVMPMLGNIKTVTKAGVIENWQWENLLPDSAVKLALLPTDSPIRFATFSPNGSLLITVHDKTSIAKIWNTSTGQLVGILASASEEIVSVRFGQTNDVAILGSLDGAAYLWTIYRNQWVLSHKISGHAKGAHAVALSHQKSPFSVVVGDGTGNVFIWDMSTGYRRLQHIFQNHQVAVQSVQFSPDDQSIISTAVDGTVMVRKNEIPVSTEVIVPSFSDDFFASALSPVGDWIVTSSYNKINFSLWKVAEIQDPKNPKKTPRSTFNDSFFGNRAAAAAITFSKDGNWFVTGQENGIARVWDFRNRDTLLPGDQPIKGALLLGHLDAIRSIAFSPDLNTILTGSVDKTAKLWDRASGQLLATLDKHTNEINQVFFSLDGQYVVTTSKDQTAMIWDITDKMNPQWISTLPHPQGVNGIAFSPIAQHLVTVCDDGLIRMWDIKDPKKPALLSSWFSHDQMNAIYTFQVAFTPDGKSLITTGGESYGFIWDIDTHLWYASLIPTTTSSLRLSLQLAGNLVMTSTIYSFLLQALPQSTPGISISLK